MKSRMNVAACGGSIPKSRDGAACGGWIDLFRDYIGGHSRHKGGRSQKMSVMKLEVHSASSRVVFEPVLNY